MGDGDPGGPVTGPTSRSGAAVRVLAGVGAAGAGIEMARRLATRRRAADRPEPPPDGARTVLLAGAFPEAAAALEALRGAGLSVAVAESCTGGLLGATLTSVPGSSDCVLGGVVAYADEVKRSLLGVPAEVLARHGAVSEPCAVAMAEGVRALLNAGVGIGITGVAGPGGDPPGKPAGLVYVCVSGPGMERRVVVLNEDLGREGNRAEAVHAALRLAAGAAAGRPGGAG